MELEVSWLLLGWLLVGFGLESNRVCASIEHCEKLEVN
jgi:hypothetical protein